VRVKQNRTSIPSEHWHPLFSKGGSLDVFRMEPLALSDELVNSPDDVSWKKSTLIAPQGN